MVHHIIVSEIDGGNKMFVLIAANQFEGNAKPEIHGVWKEEEGAVFAFRKVRRFYEGFPEEWKIENYVPKKELVVVAKVGGNKIRYVVERAPEFNL